ncbi:MAG: homocysteine S-methyltransferase family protein, partial [Pseudomonadota bacterium]
PIWVGLTCAPDALGTMCLQSDETDAVGAVHGNPSQPLVDAIAALNSAKTPLLNIMHTDVEHVNACLALVREHWDGLVGVYAHSGGVVDGDWVFEGTITPAEYAAASHDWLDQNVQIVGGCCGIRPEHMAAVAELDFR